MIKRIRDFFLRVWSPRRGAAPVEAKPVAVRLERLDGTGKRKAVRGSSIESLEGRIAPASCWL